MTDDHLLREVLLHLLSRLTDYDRERLHFFLQNDVPRPLVDDCSSSGTLKLIQSLFDQDKIREENVILLIAAFEKIGCADAAQLLKKHQHRMQLNSSTQDSPLINPSYVQTLLDDYQEDKYSANKVILNQFNQTNNNVIEKQCLVTHSTSSPQNTQTLLSSSGRRYRLISSMLFLLTLIAIIIGLVVYVIRLNDLRNENKQLRRDLFNKITAIERLQKLSLESNQQQNIASKQWTNLLSEKNAAIDRLNQTINESQKQRIISLIKVGQRFGGNGGKNFDDSLLPNFTYTHYLSGLIIFYKYDFSWYQFIYRSPYDNQSVVRSPIHGTYGDSINSTHTYHLDYDERVDEIIVESANQTFSDLNGNYFTTMIIKGFHFKTTKGQSIPADIPIIDDNHTRSERLQGYTLGYVTGKSATAIDQLQFVWYRTKR